MVVTCTCGAEFQAKDPRARYCSDRCRKRVQRSGATVIDLPTPPAPTAPLGVESSTLAALDAAGRTDTPMGQAALVLARRLDAPGLDMGSAVAAVTRQLSLTLTEALRGAGRASGPQVLSDELAARRVAHGA